MGVRLLVEGWRTTRLDDRRRAALVARLDAVSRGLAPASVLAEIHDGARSSVRLHSRVHWVELHLNWRARGLEESLRQVPPLVLAPVSSAGRRLGGLDSEAPQDPGLWVTWLRVWTRATDGALERPTSRVAPPT